MIDKKECNGLVEYVNDIITDIHKIIKLDKILNNLFIDKDDNKYLIHYKHLAFRLMLNTGNIFFTFLYTGNSDNDIKNYIFVKYSCVAVYENTSLLLDIIKREIENDNKIIFEDKK